MSKFERGERRLDVIEFIEVARQIGANPYTLFFQVEPLMGLPSPA